MNLFKYKFSTSIDRPISLDGYPAEIKVVKEHIDEKKGIIVLKSNNELHFKGTYSAWRGNICASVNSGKFTIEEDKGKLLLIYRIEIDHILVYLTLIGMSISIAFYKIWLAGMPLIWLGGMNWFISLVRNNSMMYDIAFEINQLNK